MDTRNGRMIFGGLPQRVVLHLSLAAGAWGMACSTPLEGPERAPQEQADAAGTSADDAAPPADAGSAANDAAPPSKLDAGAQGGTGGFFGAGGFPGSTGVATFVEGGVWIPWPPGYDGGRFCEDDDGLPADLERDAGLDPCAADSDGDGCGDAPELLLGGCDDRRNVLLRPACFGEENGVYIRFAAPPRDAGSWASLTLVAEPALGVRIAALGNDPSSPASSGASFRNAPAGAWLMFDVLIADPGGRAGSTVQLLLTSDDGRVVDRGKIVFLSQECPIVI